MSGELSLGAEGVRFASADHTWVWRLGELRFMARDDENSLLVETFEKDVIVLGRPKRYRFVLDEPLVNEHWSRFRRLATAKQ